MYYHPPYFHIKLKITSQYCSQPSTHLHKSDWWTVHGSISITSDVDKILLVDSRKMNHGNLTIALEVEEMLPLNLCYIRFNTGLTC